LDEGRKLNIFKILLGCAYPAGYPSDNGILRTRKASTQPTNIHELALVRRLYEKGFNEQYVINLLRFVDWMLTLPPDIEAEFKLEVKQLEAGRSMKYVTSFERSGIESGIEIGKQQKALGSIHFWQKHQNERAPRDKYSNFKHS
jgi:hypothetical protein